MTEKWDILGFGITAVDDILYVNNFPGPDVRTEIHDTQRRCGGLTGMTLIAAARLGASAAYAGMLGDDEFSALILENFARNDVNTSSCLRRPGVQPYHSTIIVDTVHGTRNIFFDKRRTIGRPADTITPDHVAAARILFLDQLHIKTMIHVAQFARQLGRTTLADFDHFNDPRMPELLELTDHLIVSHEMALAYTGAATSDLAAFQLARPRRAATIVTDGHRGGFFVDGQDPSYVVHYYPAFRVKTVNTTGCGDVFHGAYAVALTRAWPLDRCVRFAAAAGLALHAAGADLSSSAVEMFLTENDRMQTIGSVSLSPPAQEKP